jgi:dihydrofolate reductase
MGKPVIVGRKTFASMGRPLPGRQMIVLTRDKQWAHPGVEVAYGVDQAVALVAGADEAFVAGGAEIYAQTIDRATRLYITEVDLSPPCDARFPAIDPSLWRETHREQGVRGPRDEAEFVFVEFERRRP